MLRIAATATTDLTVRFGERANIRPLRDGGRGRPSLPVAIVFLALLAPLLLAGCGDEPTIAGATPQETAEAFVEAMQAGEYEKVAAGYDYETGARRENSDWDSFGEHQRNLIVEKLQEEKVAELQGLAGMFATAEASVGDVQQQDERANVSISAGANTLILQLRQIEDQWLVADVVESTGG